MRVTRIGIRIILPQTYTPFRYSQQTQGVYEPEIPPDRYSTDLTRFMKALPHCEWWHSSIDTALYRSEWRGASPITEIVEIANHEKKLITRTPREATPLVIATPPAPPALPTLTRPTFLL